MTFTTIAGGSMRAILFVVLALVVAGCAKSPGGGLFSRDGSNDSGLNNGAAAGTGQDFVVNVGDRIFFDTDSSTLNIAARATLDRQAVWLRQYGAHSIVIEGHADERGTREYNIALGGRRAAATRNYLLSRAVPGSRVTTLSYGKERPVAACNDISCWSKNRRAVTLLR